MALVVGVELVNMYPRMYPVDRGRATVPIGSSPMLGGGRCQGWPQAIA